MQNFLSARKTFLCTLVTACACTNVPFARAAGKPTLAVYPATVQLDEKNDAQRITVVLTQPDGITRDVTAKAKYAFTPDKIATLNEKKMLLPTAKGQTKLTVTCEGLTAEVQVTVPKDLAGRPVSFLNDVEPVLMKAGCNSGTCHGGARGKNGFRLSLFGFNPNMDYIHLTRQTGARRLDVADVKASMMLLKGTASAPHGGGKRIEADDRLYDILEQWIRANAPNDSGNVEKLTALEILPEAAVLSGKNSTQQLVVRARYSNGTDRDVTDLAVFSSNNDLCAAITRNGLVTAKDRGEAFIMARFGTFAVVTQIIVLPADAKFTWPENIKEQNYVDRFVHDKLKKMRIVPSEVAGDEIFLRRIYLDILGVLPTPEEYADFMENKSADKRAKLIDQLLTRPEFPELWAMKLAEMLRVESDQLNVKGVQLYTAWLRDAIVNDMPIDKIAKALLTANGGNYHNPPANFYLIETRPTSMAENVAQVFLGIRIQCTQCHNHPFERWTMDDYYSFAAFFAQIGRKGSEDPREQIVFNRGGGEVKNIRDGKVAKPKFLGGATPDLKGRDRREVVADWIASPDNPWFAQSFANRVWAHFMGRGIIDPPDDVRVSNPPSHPELLKVLGKKFAESKFDIRTLVRDICNSRTYQLSTRTNATNASDLRNFSHAQIRRLLAEQLLDAICQVTEVREKFAGLPLGARATQVADAKTGSYFLDTFGRPARKSACTCDRRNEPTLAQALHLINGPTVDGKIKSGNSRLARLLKTKQPPEAIIEQLYIASLCRKPTDKEKTANLAYVAKAPNPKSGLEDLFWAVLNSKEFVFNH